MSSWVSQKGQLVWLPWHISVTIQSEPRNLRKLSAFCDRLRDFIHKFFHFSSEWEATSCIPLLSLQEHLIEKHLVNRPHFWKWGICAIDFIRNWYPRNHFEIDVRVIWYRDGIGKKDQHSRSKRSTKRLRSENDVLVGTKSRCSVDT
jgi:hypothetical protein